MILSMIIRNTDSKRTACQYQVKTSENCLTLRVQSVQVKDMDRDKAQMM